MIIELVVPLLVFAISLVALASASHFTIRSIEELIALTGLSEASAGFVILAVMTSTPEIVVALFSVLQGTPGISIGDILGSNVFNVGAVLGILGMLGFLKTCCTDLLVELTDILFITSLIPLLLVIFKVASPIIGVILLGTFLVSIYFIAKKRTPMVKTNNSAAVGKRSRKTVATMLILSFAGVVIAARLVVSSGIDIALILGAPPILIGGKSRRDRYFPSGADVGFCSCSTRACSTGNWGYYWLQPHKSNSCIRASSPYFTFRS